MKAIVCRAFGAPETLAMEDVQSRGPGPGEIKIAIRAASVNYFDVLMIQGLYQRKPPFPFVVGTDAAGEVLAVGPGVAKIAIGDRVMTFNLSGGAFAEEMIVPEANAFIIPPNVDYSTAAALKSVYGTALHGLRDRARLNRGETLLVLGAAGGVGLAFVEIGALLGANVIGAVSTEEKADLLKRFNVRHIVNYSIDSLRDNVRELTNGNGADVIIDPVGGDLFDDALRTIAWGGRLCVVGFSSGRIPQLPLNQALLKSFDLVGVNYGGWIDKDPQAHRRETEELVRWCGSGTIRPHISTTLPLAEVAAAMRLLQDRAATGKILLSI